jgi:hypothetical protein
MSAGRITVGALCAELGITRQTLYQYVDPAGQLRPRGMKLLGLAGQPVEAGISSLATATRPTG